MKGECGPPKTPAKQRSSRDQTNANIAAICAATPAPVKFGVSQAIHDANTTLFNTLNVEKRDLNAILPDQVRYATDPLVYITTENMKSRIGAFFLSMVEAAAALILPNDDSGFLMEMLRRSLEAKKQEDPLSTVLKALKIEKSKNFPKLPWNRSTSSRRGEAEVIRLFKQSTKAIAELIVPEEQSDWLAANIGARAELDRHSKQKATVLERLTKGQFELMAAMPKHTMTYRALRANVATNASHEMLTRHLGHLLPPKLGDKARKSGRKDYDGCIKLHKDPVRPKRSLLRVKDESLDIALAHIFENVQTLSWGTKTVWKSGSNEPIILPKVTRKKTIEQMYRDFRKQQAQLRALRPEHKSVHEICRTIYRDLCRTLTSRTDKTKTCIDYVVDILINTRMSGLETIINDLVAPSERKKMIHHLGIVQNFLKYQFDEHVRLNDKICNHNIAYALGIPDEDNNSHSDKEKPILDAEHCPGCKYLEYYLRVMLPEEVKASETTTNEPLKKSINNALTYIEDSLHSCHLYQGHRVRAVNQQKAIDRLDKQMREEAMQSKGRSWTARGQADFAQKFLEKRFRSNQQVDFAQRGISWHITVIEYYQYEAPNEQNGHTERAVRVQVPLDQILKSGNKQDGACVLAMVEGMMKMVSTELPWIRDIVLVTDNANCYHSKTLIFGIPLLNHFSLKNNGVRITKQLHPETQDGKAQCDAHSSIGKKKIEEALASRNSTTEYKTACTAEEIAIALCSNGGIKNSAVQVIELDHSRLDNFVANKCFTKTSKKAKHYFSRANEIHFFPNDDACAEWTQLDMQKESNWKHFTAGVQVINYSNVSDGAKFHINFESANFQHLSKDEVNKRNECFEMAELGINLVEDAALNVELLLQEEEMTRAFICKECVDGSSDCSSDSNSFSSWPDTDDDRDDDGGNLCTSSSCDESSVGSDGTDVASDFDADKKKDDGLLLSNFEVEFDLEIANTLASVWHSEWLADEHSDCSHSTSDTFVSQHSSDEEDDASSAEASTTVDCAPDSTTPKNPDLKLYPTENFFTRAKVMRYKKVTSNLVPVPTAEDKTKRKRKEVEEYTSKTLLDRALDKVGQFLNSSDADATSKFLVRDAKATMPEYNDIAINWEPEKGLLARDKGWARRPRHGELFGVAYMNKDFQKVCEQQYERGRINKSDKQSPSQVVELIRQNNPGVYCYPPVHEVMTCFSSLGNKKSGQTRPRGNHHGLTTIDEVDSLLHGKNLNLAPKVLFQMWIGKYGESREDIVNDGDKREKVLKYIKSRRNALKKRRQKEKDRLLLG